MSEENKSLWDLDNFIYAYDGILYEVTKLDIDISEEFKASEGTVIQSHKIEGFDKPLYLIQDFNDNSFSFGVKVIEEEEGEHGLFVLLEDENVFQQAVELVWHIDNDGREEEE